MPNISPYDFGRLLATALQHDFSAEELNVLQLPQHESNYMRDLLRVIEYLQNDATVSDYLLKIPGSRCLNDPCFLAGNEEFFIIYLSELFEKELAAQPDLCFYLMRHLNDCYSCFKVFSAVAQTFLANKK